MADAFQFTDVSELKSRVRERILTSDTIVLTQKRVGDFWWYLFDAEDDQGWPPKVLGLIAVSFVVANFRCNHTKQRISPTATHFEYDVDGVPKGASATMLVDLTDVTQDKDDVTIELTCSVDIKTDGEWQTAARIKMTYTLKPR